MKPEEEDRVVKTLESGYEKHYVYALCTHDGVPFYIGKGCGRRVLDHRDAAEQAKESIAADDLLSDAEKNRKIKELTDKLKIILDEQTNLQMVIIKWGLTESEAFMCESALINLLRYTRGKTIQELTNIVNGHASKSEKDSVADTKTIARTLEVFLRDCAIAECASEQIVQKVAFIKINKLYPECIGTNGDVDDGKVKECVRGVWPIAENKRSQIEFIFALYKGRVVGIYHVNHAYGAIGDEWATGLKDFPVFPIEARKIDRWKAKYPSVQDAQQDLRADEFEEFIKTLQKEDKTEDEVLEKFRKRIYFSVDDIVPTELVAFKNCLLTKNGSGEFLKSQWPVQYNF